MATPVIVPCPLDVWTKVATNVISGQVWNVDTSTAYLQTYRDTGDPAPAAGDPSEGVPMFERGDNEVIAAAAGIDVYVFSMRTSGAVRVDL